MTNNLELQKPVLEESLKNKIARIYFDKFDSTDILGKVDFCVAENDIQGYLLYEKEKEYYLWAEAKRPHEKDIYKLLVQIILTVGRSSELRNKIPPKFLGAFNFGKIAFLPFADIQDIFSLNDFNWTVPASDYDTKEFKQLYNLVQETLKKKSYVFNYKNDDKELRQFIKKNFKKGKTGFAQIEITKSNFVAIYTRWLKEVKETIDIDWTVAKQRGILDVDFYLADLLSKNNQAVRDNLYVLLKGNHYEYNRLKTELGVQSLLVNFKDSQKAHNSFWMKYKRPPKNSYQDYIIEKRHLLVPQDVREIKGSYFTPQVWVQKSQEYLANVLGDNWQDEYYIWDCCAGTGNMENGLVNKYNVWASTLDQPDVDIMKERVKNGANLLESHIFQMDFLNDELEDKCPKDLLEIIKNPEKREKLIIYINPPYKEATSSKTITSTEDRHKTGVSNNKTYEKYKSLLGRGINELFAQFFMRIYKEIPGCILGEFSTLKILQSQNFDDFRNNFRAKLKKLFIVPANTFDNVKGEFPIGFFIWDTKHTEKFSEIKADVYDKEDVLLQNKNIASVSKNRVILNWIQDYYDSSSERLAYMVRGASDFQNNRIVFISLNPSKSVISHSQTHSITSTNLIQNAIFFAVRHCISATWINNRDQFLYPNDGWKTDTEFQSNCLIYTLFHSQNHIKSKDGINNWIPFLEKDVEPKNSFQSHFMTDYFKQHNIQFSNEARDVLEQGKYLWKYYHSKNDSNQNASFYDIREYFQGKDSNGRMNNRSSDETYSILVWNLRQALKQLEKKITPKIYEYGFLYK